MITMDKFNGLSPVLHPRELPPTAAQRALEVELEDGTLTPLHNHGAAVGNLTQPNDRSMFRYRGSWLSWAGDVCVEHCPVGEDIYDRIYYTGDGSPKLRAHITGVDHVRALGIPAPQDLPNPLDPLKPINPLAASTVGKSSVSWTRQWHAFYEGVDGTRSSESDIPALDVTEVTPGTKYVISPKPAGSGGTLVVWFEAFTAEGSYLGSVYPDISVYRTNNDLLLNGAAVNSLQVTGATDVTINLQYNTSRLTGFNLERVYVFTWVSDIDEEGPPGSPRAIDVSPAQDVDLVIPDIPPYAWITKKRIYRTVTVGNDTQYQLVVELPVATSNYTDTLYDVDLPGDELISTDFDPPPAGLRGLVAMPGSFFAGFVGNLVYFSEPGYPHAWPLKYATSAESLIKCLGVAGNTLTIGTNNRPYILSGFSPEGMQPTKITTPYAATSERGVAELDGVVYFISNNGIVSVRGQSPELWTKAVIGDEYWKALNPSTMRMIAQNARLYVFHDTGFLMFDLSGGQFDLTESAQVVQAYHVDPATDEVFVSIAGGNGILPYGAGALRTLIYRSKDFISPRPTKMAAFRVMAGTYPVTLRVYSEDGLAATKVIADDRAGWLPSTPPSKLWSLEIEAPGKVYSVEAAGSIQEIVNGR